MSNDNKKEVDAIVQAAQDYAALKIGDTLPDVPTHDPKKSPPPHIKSQAQKKTQAQAPQGQEEKIAARRAEIAAGNERSKQAKIAMQAIIKKNQKTPAQQVQNSKKTANTSLMLTILRVATEEIGSILSKITKELKKDVKKELDKQAPRITKALERDIKMCRSCMNFIGNSLKWLAKKTFSAVQSLGNKAPTAKEALTEALETTNLKTGAPLTPEDQHASRSTKTAEPEAPEEPDNQSLHKPQ